jgi:opacity protein-like surface antigen
MMVAAAASAAALAVSAATAEAANKVLMVNGLGAGNLTDLAMANILGGAYGGTNWKRENVPWPQQARPLTGRDSLTLTESINVGTKNLDAAIVKSLTEVGPGEKVTVVGLSAGALVVDEQIRLLDSRPNAPGKDKLDFVVIADSSRAGFNRNRYDATIGYQYAVPVESKYNVTVVTGQYDGYADPPDRPDPVAIANAAAGSQLVHIPAMLSPLSAVPASNITTRTNAKGGVTTSYLVPTETLPLVALNPRLKAQEATLRKQIDAAYVRNAPTQTNTVADQARYPVVTAPVVNAPVVTAPVVTAPVVTAPVVTAPVVTAPVVTAPTIKAPTIKAPTIKIPTIKIPTIKAPTIKAPTIKIPTIKAPVVRAAAGARGGKQPAA